MNEAYVYHSSAKSGLKTLNPRVSTHKKPWVYATKNIASSAMFMGKNNDLFCQTGVMNSKPYIWERFQGALHIAYQGRSGSIYLLDPSTFKEGQTSWSEEVVSDQPVTVVEEIIVENVIDFLKELELKGELKIYHYPEAPQESSKDKQDLIDKAVKWTMEFGEDTLNEIEEFHPDLTSEVLKKLRSNGYQFKNAKWSGWL